MKSFQTIIGIDVAQDTLAISIFDGKTHQIKELDYTKRIIRKELITPFRKVKESVVFVMESTGIYHTRLAYWLASEELKISVVNPLIIKRYTQMHLMRIKTDSADAKLIAEYGYEYQHKLSFFRTKDESQIAVDNLVKAIDDLLLQRTMTNNQHHALKKQANYSKEALDSYKRHLKFIKDEIKRLEKTLQTLLENAFNQEYELLRSIPGIGLKVSAMIIAVFNGFENFESAKQACSFAGIAPSPYESGTSVKGRGSISKRGNIFARKMLYMGALVATIHNPLIRQQYQRLVENGKSKMVAMVAAANKLLRQAFGVLKSGKPFDLNYVKEYNM
jgi:transposase